MKTLPRENCACDVPLDFGCINCWPEGELRFRFSEQEKEIESIRALLRDLYSLQLDDGEHASEVIERVNKEIAKGISTSTKRQELEIVNAENNVLRSLLPALGAPCVYCGLTEIAKCSRGFPGCAQADDILVGEEEGWRETLRRLRSAEKALAAPRQAHKIEYTHDAQGNIALPEGAPFDGNPIIIRTPIKGWVEAFWDKGEWHETEDGPVFEGFNFSCSDDSYYVELDEALEWIELPISNKDNEKSGEV